MSYTKIQNNDVILTIRMPAPLLTQLEALAKTKYLGVSTMARQALAEYLTKEAPSALLSATPVVQTSQPKPQVFSKPSQRSDVMSEDERLEAKARYEAREAARLADMKARTEARMNGTYDELYGHEEDDWA